MPTKVLTLTPTNSWAKSHYGIADLIAASATFQSIVGAATAAAARAYVSCDADDTGDSTELRPRAIVTDAEHSHTKFTNAGYIASSVYDVSFEFPPTEAYVQDDNRWDQAIEFKNRIGAIINELTVLQGIAESDYFAPESHIAIDRFELTGGPEFLVETVGAGTENESQEYYWSARFRFYRGGQ